MRGFIPTGLDRQIDTPRTYRQEQLPKSVPWDVVCKFLESIDRSDVQGLRDYAIFLLIASYGLRASDAAGLRLEDVNWRAGEIHIKQRKTKHPLILPLFDHVGEALIAYLRNGRPSSKHREIFLTLRAPISPVTIHTIGPAFRSRVRRGKLPIPFEGVHCLRHSYAMHLLTEGASLKAIGDVLGHHSTESTCVYLRLNFQELRDVGLPLPVFSKEEAGK
jgi:site-specific recombinase XerD